MFHWVIVSLFRKKKQGPNLVEKVQVVDNCNAYTTFWITWTDKVLKIGLGANIGSAELMRYSDSGMPAINVMSVATGWGATGQWEIVDCSGIEGSILILLVWFAFKL